MRKLESILDKFPKYHMKILLGDLNAKVGREDIFKLTINNDNGVRVVNFATSNKFTAKSTVFPHRNIHKCTWTSPGGNTHNQIDHILIDRRRHSSVLDVRSFRAAQSSIE
jgi:endonuclease/exonuclease/phosphatase family metal-dependent hydrolase